MKKIMFFAVILFSIALAYAAFHVAAYFSTLHFFSLTSPFARKTLLAVFIFLGLSFFAATFLSHLRSNIFTTGYYFFAGSWVGILINLVIFFAIAWAVSILCSLMGIAVQEKIIGAFAICAAVIYSAYGIWNAFAPMVTHLNVEIENLPGNWAGKKIVQISDVHLGHIYGPKYMEGVAQKINAMKPDAIVITGDLFDGTDGNLDVFAGPLGKLDAPEGIFYITGNHETYLGIEKAMHVISQTKIIPLRDEMRTADGLQFIGIDYPQRMETKDIGAVIGSLRGFDRQKPSVLLWHMPSQIEAAKNAGISLQLSGHTHKGQLFPLGFITALVYKGYDYGYKKEGSYSIYTSSGLGGWGPPMRTEKTSEIVEITLQQGK